MGKRWTDDELETRKGWSTPILTILSNTLANDEFGIYALRGITHFEKRTTLEIEFRIPSLASRSHPDPYPCSSAP